MHIRLCIMFGCGSRDTRGDGRPIVDGIVSFVFVTVNSFVEQKIKTKKNNNNKKQTTRTVRKFYSLDTIVLVCFLSSCDLSSDRVAFHNPTANSVFRPSDVTSSAFFFRSILLPALLENTRVTFVNFRSSRFRLETQMQAQRRIFPIMVVF